MRTFRMVTHRAPPSHLRQRKSRLLWTCAVLVGAVGLAALAVAIAGPRRLRVKAWAPVGDAVTDQAEHLWVESRPLRVQLGQLVRQAANPEGREKLVRSLQSWIGHFRAG